MEQICLVECQSLVFTLHVSAQFAWYLLNIPHASVVAVDQFSRYGGVWLPPGVHLHVNKINVKVRDESEQQKRVLVPPVFVGPALTFKG